MEFLTVDDLTPFVAIDEAKALEMIADATAMASLAAPCLAADDLAVNQAAAVKAILRGAVIRWHEAGSGALQAETAGPFSHTFDTRQARRGMFWPSEIAQLRDICSASAAGRAFSLDTTSRLPSGHAEICSLNFGALYCSCGAVLYGAPM